MVSIDSWTSNLNFSCLPLTAGIISVRKRNLFPLDFISPLLSSLPFVIGMKSVLLQQDKQVKDCGCAGVEGSPFSLGIFKIDSTFLCLLS